MIPSGCGCSRIAAEAAKLGLGWLLNAAFQGKPTKTNCQPRHWLAARLRLERAETDTSAVVRRRPDRPALDGMVVQIESLSSQPSSLSTGHFRTGAHVGERR
jgi:hypothetical protein